MNFQPRFLWRFLLPAFAAGAFFSNQSLTGQDMPETNRDYALVSITDSLFALNLSPGMAVGVVRGDSVIFLRGYGYADVEAQRPVTPQTAFYIASVTKSFTAFAAQLLHLRGDFDLDKAVSFYLPDLQLHAGLSPDSISIRDLLTHTHGIDGGPVTFRTAYTGEYSNTQLLELMRYHKPAESGRNFNYGNIGYNLAGLAMEAHLNRSWKDIEEQDIFQPLGMRNTSAKRSTVNEANLAMPYAPDGAGFRRLPYAKQDANMHAAGGHVTSAEDMASWLRIHLNDGRLAGKQLFPAQAVRETHRLQAVQDRNFSHFHRFGWGLGWDLGIYEGDTLLHRFGSFPGFRPHVSFMPQQRIGVVVLVNETFLGGNLADQVACSIYDRLLGKPDFDRKFSETLKTWRKQAAMGRERLSQSIAERAARAANLPLPQSAYTGIFSNPQFGAMHWTESGRGLEIRMGLLQNHPEIYNGPQSKFRVDWTGGGEIISFVLKDGVVTALEYRGEVFGKE